jgi:hypothetical protein
MMLSVLDLIPLFKNIGDAWIRVCWQEISTLGSGYLNRNHSLLDFALHQDVGAKTVKGKAGFMFATVALTRLQLFLFKR